MAFSPHTAYPELCRSAPELLLAYKQVARSKYQDQIQFQPSARHKANRPIPAPDDPNASDEMLVAAHVVPAQARAQ
ncbi:hypothetical protein D3C73_1484600 [compost metagenome]